MKARLGVAAAVVAAWWITLNVGWVTIGDKQLTGGELAGWLNLIPPIALAALFIAGYGKFKVLLIAISTFALGTAGFLIFAINWISSPAVTQVLETISGVMNADQHMAGVSVTNSPLIQISGFIAFLGAAAAIWAILPKRAVSQTSPEEDSDSQFSDNRALWDEQS